MSFTHLRTRTHHSITEGLMDPKEIAKKAAELGQTSVALTDLNTLSGLPAFYAEAEKLNVNAIFGLELYLETDLSNPENKDPTRILLIAQNDDGYKKLMEIITRSQVENNTDHSGNIAYKQSWLKQYGVENLIALSGTPDFGEVPRAAMQEDKKKASSDVKNALAVYKDIFGDKFFLEVSRNAHDQEELWVDRMVALATHLEIPLVATHGVMFKEREDFFPHEVHTAITTKKSIEDPAYIATSTREQYFLSEEEMYELFSDIPQAVDNAGLIAQSCKLTRPFGDNQLPAFPLPEGENSIDEYFVKLSREGLDKRLVELFPDENVRKSKYPEYSARLEEELGVILKMGFPGYFLVVSDFIRWSKDQGIPVGPGRGSGAGSLIAYVLNITDIDPIEHVLLFERFLNPERVSMPDIDVDFCRDRRDETIRYIFEKYGHESVAQIATVSSLAPRAAIRHAGKALNLPLPFINEIAKLIPNSPEITFKKAFEINPKLGEVYEDNKRTRRLLDMAIKLEKTTLTTGVHAGGVVISPTVIEDYAPMMRSEKGVMVTQYNKNDVETAGLIKFDILGLKTLTIVDEAVKLINRRDEFSYQPFDIRKLDQNDPEALKLLREGRTYGVFQLEKRGITNMIKKMKPTSFEDVAVSLALYRPGPLEAKMVDSFILRRDGQEEIDYFHPKLEKVLKPTLGIIVYQEQVMQIAREIAGYSLGGADLLRRAMGKKDAEKMAKEREKFEEGAVKNGYDRELATKLFDLMEKFASYGFNRSHSAAYAVISMQTASLKARYPTEFYTSYMNIEIETPEVLELAIADARMHNIEIVPPDINRSFAKFEILEANRIDYGLAGIKSVSENIVDSIVDAREKYGNFESLPDFLFKVNAYLKENGINAQLKSITEKLISCGAFDSMEPNRAMLLKALPAQLDYIQKYNKRSGVVDETKGILYLPKLWSAINLENPIGAKPKTRKKALKPLIQPEMPLSETIPEFNLIEKLNAEKSSFGYHFSDHAYNANIKYFKGMPASLKFEEVDEYNLPYDNVLICGVVQDLFEREVKNGANAGSKMANVTLSDGEKQLRITLFADLYANYMGKIKEGQFIGFEASVKDSRDPKYGIKSVNAVNLLRSEEMDALLAKEVHIVLSKNELEVLSSIHEQYSGDRLKTVVYIPDGENKYFKASLPNLSFNGSVECLDALKTAFSKRVDFEYLDKIEFAPAPRRNNNNNNRM